MLSGGTPLPEELEELLEEELLELLEEELLELLEEELLELVDDELLEEELLEDGGGSSSPAQATKPSARTQVLASVIGLRQSAKNFIRDIVTYLFYLVKIRFPINASFYGFFLSRCTQNHHPCYPGVPGHSRN